MVVFLCFESSILQSNLQRRSPRERPWPRGRPRGHILKSLALALALASGLKSLKINLSSARGQHYFFELLKFLGALEKFFEKRFFVEIA